jgi:arabinoxylan arabinofuranohydrolase
MTDWWVWSSPDLVSWTLADVLLPNATPAAPSDYGSCWATDGAHRKDPATGAWEYFFYMSIGKCQTAVMKSTASPAGPWVNVLGAPLLNASLGDSLSPKACFRDPAVFEDDDGAHYIISGVFDYYIMRLGDDLVSLAEAPRLVKVLNPTGPYGAKTDDKPFIHKANGLYYLSWGCFYGTSASVYGPYTYAGSAIDTAAISPDFRTNSTSGPWYSHEDYADRHGSFWTAAGQWFYASNDRSHSTDRRNAAVFRDTVVGYVHYFANSSIAPVAINGTGVGEYAAAHVEAENFMALRGGARKVHLPARGDAFVVAVEEPRGATLAFPNVRGLGAALRVVAANAGARAVRVAAHVGAAERAAVCTVPPTGGEFVEVACPLAAPPGAAGAAVDVVLSFEGGPGLQIDSWSA